MNGYLSISVEHGVWEHTSFEDDSCDDTRLSRCMKGMGGPGVCTARMVMNTSYTSWFQSTGSSRFHRILGHASACLKDLANGRDDVLDQSARQDRW